MRNYGVHKTFNVHLYIAFLMTGIKFVPTSEWQVLHRTEECAERTWDRVSGAPLVLARKRELSAASRLHIKIDVLSFCRMR